MRRYCDIVMKGGITSGVVYPLAALELAKDHRFRNIGGTSAGAIAGLLPGVGLLAAASLLHGDAALRIFTALAGALLLPAGVALAIAASAAWRLHGLPRSYFGICLGNDRNDDHLPQPGAALLAPVRGRRGVLV
jgi:hypothetical protein